MTIISKVKQTLANLNGAAATIRAYSLQEQNEEAKDIYKDSLEVIDNIIKDLDARVDSLEFEEPQYKGK